jgi:polyhydroxybutyrate depolymerase
MTVNKEHRGMSSIARRMRACRVLARGSMLVLLAACGGAQGAEESPASMQTSAQPTSGQAGVSGSAGAAQQPSAAGEAAAGSGQAGVTAGSAGQPSGGMRADAAGSAAPDAGAVAAVGGMGAQAGSAGSPDVAGAGGSAGATPEPCPAENILRAGDNRKTLMHDGRERRFNVYVPSSIMAMQRVPLVLDFHGNGSSGAQEQSGSGWRQKADAEQFIVVYPDGVGNGWNVGNCCGEALNSMVDDVGFARAMVENVSTEACIDAHRVYATGISNGAGLAHRLACEAADVFAAIAAASADLVTDPCQPSRPIAEISIRGLNDTLVAYEGGNTGSTGWYSPGAKGTLELWKNIDGCTGSPETTIEHCESYTECKAGVEVTLCSLPGTGHILYTNSLGFSVPDNAWEMFKRQTLP